MLVYQTAEMFISGYIKEKIYCLN